LITDHRVYWEGCALKIGGSKDAEAGAQGECRGVNVKLVSVEPLPGDPRVMVRIVWQSREYEAYLVGVDVALGPDVAAQWVATH